MSENKILLSNGYEIEKIGYGSSIITNDLKGIKSKLREGKIYLRNKKQHRMNVGLSKCLDGCMKSGINMFDTSRAYGKSEKVIGDTLKKYKREEYKIITKLCNADQYKGDIRRAFETSLKTLNLEYIDVYLMHWPVTDCFVSSWKEIEKIYEEKLCKAIGVCNFDINHFEQLSGHSNYAPMINQIECHPLFTQEKNREYCMDNKIQVMAYTPTARMDERLKKTVLVPIGEKYGKSIAQVILRWHTQIGNIPIVNTNNVKHATENIQIYDFELTNEEIEMINKININSRLRYDPNNCDFRQL